MSSTNKTANLELSQFLANDTPAWLVDYNGDMLKIDNGFGTVQSDSDEAKQIANGAANSVTNLTTTVNAQAGAIANVQSQATQNTNSITGINQKLGLTDISGIGDGTVTGAIADLASGGATGGSVTRTVLWSNSSPTSAFGAQTISLVSDDYDELEVVFTSVNAEADKNRGVVKIPKGFSWVLSVSFATQADGVTSISRSLIYTSNTAYSVQDCYRATAGGLGATYNIGAIPIAIYGIKYGA